MTHEGMKRPALTPRMRGMWFDEYSTPGARAYIKRSRRRARGARGAREKAAA